MVVIYLDALHDLSAVGLMLDTHSNTETLDGEEVERREAENARRVQLFEEAYASTLSAVGREQGLTVYLETRDESAATSTPTGDNGDTLERLIWQEAHDRTPVARADADDPFEGLDDDDLLVTLIVASLHKAGGRLQIPEESINWAADRVGVVGFMQEGAGDRVELVLIGADGAPIVVPDGNERAEK